MSNVTKSGEEPAQAVIAHAEREMRDIDPSPFSLSAFAALKTNISGYVDELITESIKVSKRHRADSVSAAHVERAAEYLVSSTYRRFYRHLGTVGGIILGAALSNLVTMTVTNQYTGLGTILSAGMGIAGAFMIALHIAND